MTASYRDLAQMSAEQLLQFRDFAKLAGEVENAERAQVVIDSASVQMIGFTLSNLGSENPSD